MGPGAYLAVKTEREHYESELKRENSEVETVPDKETREVKDVVREYGISEAGQNILAKEMAAEKTKWVNFMLRFELGL